MKTRLNRPIHLVLIQPDGYLHSAALAELAETLIYGLDALGAPFEFVMNRVEAGRTNLILGAHLLGASASLPLKDVILYNSEQADVSSAWINPSYLDLLKRHAVWDYSEENIRRFKTLGVDPIKYVPIGYSPRLTRILRAADQDIDILFYGSINERRRVILEALILKGLRVEVLSGVYRETRDRYIARARVVLNIHYYDASIFEIVRVSWLLANKKAVVAECGDSTTLEPDIQAAVCAVPYARLVDACAELVNDAKKRESLEQQGFAIFSKRDEAAILSEALKLSAPLSAHSKAG